MIHPIVHEDIWLPRLGRLPAFDPGNGPIVFVSPHPDDETLGAGGFLAAQAQLGRAVTVVAVTNGEHAYADNQGLAEVRISEQNEAVRVLCDGQAKLTRLGLTDSALAAEEGRLVELLTPLVAKGTHVLAPWVGDFHPDHEVCARAAAAAAQQAGARLSWYFFWTWHRGTPATIESLTLYSFPLNDALQKTKLDALLCHSSQLEHPSGEPILPESLLAPARRNFEVFAE